MFKRPEQPKHLGVSNFYSIGLRGLHWRDKYHFFLNASWGLLVGFSFVLFIGTIFVFACGYTLCGDSLGRPDKANLLQSFWFSMHTFTTIGYGHMYPTTTCANVLVTLQSFTGMVMYAVTTGLVFSKFSIPRARINFSERAVITVRNGKPSLIFRLANERANSIIQATIVVVMAYRDVTMEGESCRRLIDLKLERDMSPLFSFAWTIIHSIDEDSPLWGKDADFLTQTDMFLVATVQGLDNVSGQTIHAQHTYYPHNISWNRKLKDILIYEETSNKTILDFRNFHSLSD